MSDDQATTVVQPLAGQGLVTRKGELLLLCADTASGVDDLLALLHEVAGSGGDGSVLVRRVAALLANDFDSQIAACAVSGPTADGRLAVLVYGSATAEIVNGDGAVSLSGADAITSVDRLVQGPIAQVRLELPGAGAANPRTRLDAGVVVAAGILAVTTRATTSGAAEPSAEPVYVDSTPGYAEPAVEPVPLPTREPGAAVEFVGIPTAVGTPPQDAPIEVPVAVSAFEVPVEDLAVEDSADEESAVEEAAPTGNGHPLVYGVSCSGGHFNDPSLSLCAVCGVAMTETVVTHEAPRPALGTLLLDDGTVYPLDLDYLLGREPEPDPDVVAGLARPLRILDPEGLVSRRHVRIALSGWEVRVVDLGSANGTAMQPAGAAAEGLPPNQPVVLTPGTVVSIGRRWFRYEAVRQP